MPNHRQIERLRSLLARQPVLRGRGYTFSIANDDVLIARGPHVRGLWRCLGEEFGWIPAGYSEPTHHVPDADAAMRYTLVVIATAP